MEEGEEETVRLQVLEVTKVLLREEGEGNHHHPFPQLISLQKGRFVVVLLFKLARTVIFRSISANPGALVRDDGDDGKDGIQRHLRSQFQSYSRLGDRRSDGSHITIGQSDKWLKQVQPKICLTLGLKRIFRQE